MQKFNKVVVALLLLALIPVCTIGLIVPREALELLQEGIDTLLERVDGSPSIWQLVLSGLLALLIDVVLIALLYFQFRRTDRTTVRVSQVAGGEAEIMLDALANRLKYYIDLLSDVLDVEPRIAARGKSVEVTVDVETATHVDLPAKAEEISNVIRRVVEELGLQLKGAPKLRLSIAPYPEAPTAPAETERTPPSQEAPAADWSPPQPAEPEPAVDEGEPGLEEDQ